MRLRIGATVLVCLVLAGCGGGGDRDEDNGVLYPALSASQPVIRKQPV